MAKITLRPTGDVATDRNFQELRDQVDKLTAKLQDSGNLRIAGSIGVGNSQVASAVGTLVGKIQIFDSKGNSLGYLPVYKTIT